jgi:hypothetical protein
MLSRLPSSTDAPVSAGFAPHAAKLSAKIAAILRINNFFIVAQTPFL